MRNKFFGRNMFKRIALAVALTLSLSVPAMAENSGFYVGLKFLDAIQSTGSMSEVVQLLTPLMSRTIRKTRWAAAYMLAMTFIPYQFDH